MNVEGIEFIGDIFKDHIFTGAGCDCSVKGKDLNIVNDMVVVIIING